MVSAGRVQEEKLGCGNLMSIPIKVTVVFLVDMDNLPLSWEEIIIGDFLKIDKDQKVTHISPDCQGQVTVQSITIEKL